MEAKYFFKDPINVLVYSICREGVRHSNNVQIKKLILEDTWTDIIIFGRSPDRINPFRLWSKLRRRYNIKRVFVGDVGSEHMRAALANHVQESYLLDDGVGTLDAQDWFLRRGSARVSFHDTPYDYATWRGRNLKAPSWKICLKKQFQNILMPVNRYSHTIHLFTVFDLEPVGEQKIIKNRYESLKLKKIKKIIDPSIVWFFGHGPSEDGGLKLAEEVNILKQICDYYSARAIKVHYMPHRNESVQRLHVYKEYLGMVIETPEWPAEIETVLRKRIPAHIGAFSSTALFTLPLLQDFATVTSFRLAPKKSVYSEALDNYLSARIVVVDLNVEGSTSSACTTPDSTKGERAANAAKRNLGAIASN